MAAINPSIKDILCLEKIPTVLEKSYEMEGFVTFCWGKIGHGDATE